MPASEDGMKAFLVKKGDQPSPILSDTSSIQCPLLVEILDFTKGLLFEFLNSLS